MADVFFPEVQPSMRKKTYSTGREKSAGSGGVTHTSRCLSVAHKSTTGQRFVADHGFLPYPPLTFIKILTPIVFLLFFSHPKTYNYSINGSKKKQKKTTINNTNKIKTFARHEESITKSHCTESLFLSGG